MCGIAGLIEFRNGQPSRDALEAMVACQAHRGPDNRGFFVKDNVALGHRRLSIIDLTGGAQPFANASGSAVITYNGELYNYKELRETLRRRGRSFVGDSDTEVVLQAYEEWGTRCLDRLDGMFAMAIADFAKREVFIARDRFGIKPLVYFYDGNRLAFASEIHALKNCPGWTGEIDLDSIDQYLRLQYIPEPRTAFRKAHKLPAGHFMTVRMGEPFFKVERYWEPVFRNSSRGSISDDELDEVLRDSVRRHLVADVPFGAFLSGGVDSSLIVSYMAEILPRPVSTFSIGFDDASVSELDEARKVAARFSTDHHEEVVHADALGILPKVVAHYGEPFGDQSAIPTWYVASLARKSVPMVLSGDGGDELFAGYITYGRWIERMIDLVPPDRGIKSKGLKLARKVWPSRYASPDCAADDPANWLDFVGRLRHDERESLWRPEFRFLTDSPTASIDELLSQSSGIQHRRVQELDLRTFLPSDILTKVDIASMAFGLEVRPPILDLEVFQAAARVRPDQLYSLHRPHEFEGKLPLKRLLARHMGKDFTRRPKQGFTLPLDKWLFEDKGPSEEIRSRLTSSDSPLRNWFAPEGIELVLNKRNGQNVWLLLVLDEWMRQGNASAGASRDS